MANESLFSKLRRILEPPNAPAHIQQRGYDVVIPWYKQLWHAIRPPSAVPRAKTPMSSSQKRMLRITGAIVAPLLAAAGVYHYISTAPERARATYDEGMKRVGPGDFSGAIEQFSKSISTFETAQAFLQRGNAHKSLGHGREALADWTRALEMDPNLADAYTARGTYYELAGDAAKAIADLDRSLQLAPTVDGYYQRGQLHSSRGEYEAAIQDFDRAIAQRREAPYVYLARSVARRALGDEEGFKQDQETAASLQRAP